jgi:hypothetical protein
LLATGGSTAAGYALAQRLGHTIIPPVPSLFTFTVPDPRLGDLAGIVVDQTDLLLRFTGVLPGEKKPPSFSAQGILLITHWGLSGPAVLRLSAWGARALAAAGYRAELQVNWLPPHTPESLLPVLRTAGGAHPRQHVSTHNPTGRLSLRLWKSLVAGAGISSDQPWNELSSRLLRRLAEELTRGVFQVQGKGEFKDEFVTAGGVNLKEVDFKTMQSRLVPGLFFAGEYLDIDGLTGGFNLQAAWTTGWIAGQSAAMHRVG